MTEFGLGVYVAAETAMMLAFLLSAALIPSAALLGKSWRYVSWAIGGVHMFGLTYFWIRGLTGDAPDARYYIATNGMFVLFSGLVILVRQTRLRRYRAGTTV
ncbi:MAG: hypothetical protein Q8K99_11005 [Actinomycetota bacterium]|nr:hypothetical protein [Actinomycetota bacterium]